jgi:hypothetical protein
MKNKIFKISSLIISLYTINLAATTYLVTLDNKHYNNSIVITKDKVPDPIDPTTGITNYVLTLTDADQTNDILNNSVLYDGICYRTLGSGTEVCNSLSYPSRNGYEGRGTSHYFDITFENPRLINYIKSDVKSYVNCGGSSRLRVTYKDSNGSYISTGISLGGGNYSLAQVSNLDITTDNIRLVSDNGSCNASITTLSEFRIY